MLYSLKSRKTFEKLHSDELNINFSFEYDTEEKMDSAFKNFCGEYIDSEFRSTKNNFSPKKVFFLEEKLQIQEKEKESDLWSLLEDKIKTSLKKTDNPVTKYFKNPLIAAVIESLIIKTVEKTFQIKVHMENREDLIPPK